MSVSASRVYRYHGQSVKVFKEFISSRYQDQPGRPFTYDDLMRLGSHGTGMFYQVRRELDIVEMALEKGLFSEYTITQLVIIGRVHNDTYDNMRNRIPDTSGYHLTVEGWDEDIFVKTFHIYVKPSTNILADITDIKKVT